MNLRRFALVLSLIASTQVAAFHRTETLRRMIRYGLRNSPKVKLLIEDSRFSLYDYQKEVSRFYPSWQSGFSFDGYSSPSVYSTDVSAGSSSVVSEKNHQWYSSLYQTLPTDTELFVKFQTERISTTSQNALLSPFYSSSLKLGGTQRLLSGYDWFGSGLGDHWSKIVVNKKNYKGSLLGLEYSLSQLIYDVEAAYLNLTYLSQRLTALEKAIEVTEKQLAFVNNKIKAGLYVPADSFQVEERLESRKVDLLETKKDFEKSKASLILLLGLNEIQQEDLIKNLNFSLPAFEDISFVNPDEFMRRAAQNNRNILMYRNNMEASEAESKRYKSLSLPTLDLEGAYVLYGGNSLTSKGYGSDLHELFDTRTDGWELGVNLTVPLGPGPEKYDYKRAKNQYRKQRDVLLSEENQLRADIVQSIRNANSDKELYFSTLKLIELAEKKLNFEQKKFESGLSTNFQVLIYQEDLTNARVKNLKAQIDYFQSQSRLDFLMGTLLSEYSVKIDEKSLKLEE